MEYKHDKYKKLDLNLLKAFIVLLDEIVNCAVQRILQN